MKVVDISKRFEHNKETPEQALQIALANAEGKDSAIIILQDEASQWMFFGGGITNAEALWAMEIAKINLLCGDDEEE